MLIRNLEAKFGLDRATIRFHEKVALMTVYHGSARTSERRKAVTAKQNHYFVAAPG